MTAQRKKILNLLKDNTRGFLSAKEIKTSLPETDLVTIYRSLDLFVQEGLVREMKDGSESRFEYRDDHHHHAVCHSCDKVAHIDIPQEILASIPGLEAFQQDDLEVLIRGKCVGH